MNDIEMVVEKKLLHDTDLEIVMQKIEKKLLHATEILKEKEVPHPTDISKDEEVINGKVIITKRTRKYVPVPVVVVITIVTVETSIA